jgi:RNA polymerase sigma-70 factor (TIGR02960 family)
MAPGSEPVTTPDARARALAATHLEAAQSGDRRAFDQLISPYHRELLAHCYRMLGSIHDADHALQDTLLRAWQGIGGYAGRSSLRTWLFRIATNAAIVQSERRGRAQTPMDPHWLEPYPHQEDDETSPAAAVDRRESLELAFVAAVQQLSPKERAVLLLREVLGFSAQETAEVLDITVAAVTSRLQRARVRVRSRLPEESQGILRRLDDRRLRALVAAYVDAWEAGDADAIVSLLTDDASFSMPPQALTIRGREEIGAFFRETPLRHPWRLVPTSAGGGQLAFGNYTLEGSTWTAHSVDVVSLRGDKISAITAFIEPSLLPILGLPEHLDDTGQPSQARPRVAQPLQGKPE